MRNIVFEHDPDTRKATKYFLWLQLGAVAVVFLLIALKLHGLAVGLSFLTFILFIGLILWLYIRYQGLPLVKEKLRLQQHAMRQQNMIAEEQRHIAAARQKRNNLLQAEKAEKDATLSALQSAHIQRGLATHSIQDATIPGVGPKLKERLAIAGITTALQVSEQAVSQVQGFGESKRTALMNWRSAIYTQFDSTKPLQLSDEQLHAIQQKYKAEHESNDSREKTACDNLDQAEGALHADRQRLKELAPVTFLGYLGNSFASKGYMAVLVGVVLISSQLISGVSATSSAIVASIPTATFTPSLTPTFTPTLTATLTLTPTTTNTPTITSTPTITNTPTITFTPTITSTATRTFTPRPTQTKIPTITSTRPPPTVNPLQGVTAICNDGTYSYSQSQRGTCSHHGGVKEWINRPPN